MSKGKILVVDDDPFVLKSVRATLEGAGYDVATYRSAITVPLDLREQKPDLVLLDVTMPDLVAKDAVKGMRKLPVMEGVPIILFSSKDEKELQEAVQTAGASGYIAKGLDHELVAGIKRYMPRARQ
jgi:two-component system KDP operon response regulator KdpE